MQTVIKRVLLSGLLLSLCCPIMSVQAATSNKKPNIENVSSASEPAQTSSIEESAPSEGTDSVIVADEPDTTLVPEEVMAKAEAQNKTVVREATGFRNANSRHYQLSDGSYLASITLGDQNYMDDTGTWQPIQTRLVDEADLDSMNMPLSQASSTDLRTIMKTNKELRKEKKIDKTNTDYRAPQVPFDVKIPKKINKGYSIGKGAEKLSFYPLGANSVTGSVYGNKVNYNEAWTNTDLQLEVLDSGLKETIILKNNQAPTTFQFQITSGDLNNLTNFTLQAPWLVDAVGTKKDVQQTIRVQDGKQFIELKVDPTGLEYPIIIDPSVLTKVASQDASCDYDAFCSSSSQYTSTLTLGSNDYYYNANSIYAQFDTSSIPLNSLISSATMKLYIEFGYDDNSYNGSAYLITSPWNENTLNIQTRPTYDSANPVPYSTGWYGAVLSSGYPKPGWMQVDVKPFVQSWSTGTANNGVLLTLNGYQSTKFIYSKEYEYSTYRPQLIVNYESPPIQPTILTPNGGETIDTTYNISWSPATDPDTVQSQLKYQVQLTQDGGASWTDIVALTTAGQIQLNYDFSTKPNSTNNLIRVRAYDGVQYGAWDASNSVFTIKHNQAPAAPTTLTPGSTSSSTSVITIGSPTLTWTFTDPDSGDTQTAYQIQIYNGTTLVKDSGWISSALTSYSVPAGTLARNTTYNWKVRTKDNAGAISAFSPLYYVKANALPTAAITSYSDGQQMADNVLTFTWNYNDANGQAQSNYQILGSQNNWATITYNSGVLNGTATSFTTAPLASGTWSFKILVKDGMEWSGEAYRNNLTLPNAFEPNDTSAQAFPINYNQNYTSLINSSTDIDFYKFTATANEIDRFVLNVPAGLNYDVYVYDSTMKLVTAGIQSTGIAENVLFDVKAGSVYYVKIVGVGGNNSTSVPYSFILAPATMQFQTIYQYDSNGNIISKTTTTTS
ncbi:DNRLRE domain-containing protein [Paenibacillus sp. MMS18-CY102]|uniref:DNRLRE domain-containing protein n=1 Tax=Paenibacillus sp. MMS18-CY102 TaxID=2682849 RepID=UPI00136525E1|nr:DNRLRE domain-containing protein [Paenibacillus sp. MMS18-CY102]MWC29489.1 DNRLRE domain-containing protein [Paenibacillus sp. MMS18-CY102]